MRGLIRLLLILVLVAIVGYWVLGYRPGTLIGPIDSNSDGAPAAGAAAPGDSTGTSGRVDRDAIRERGAEVGERVAGAGAVVAESVAEASLTAKIKAKMALDDRISAGRIDVTTEGSTVTLTGRVGSQEERERAVRMTRETDGVVNVVDQLTVR